MSGQIDPNVHAEELAELSRRLAQEARVEADRLRQGAAASTEPRIEHEPVQEPQPGRGETNGQLSHDSQHQGEGSIAKENDEKETDPAASLLQAGFAPKVASWVASVYGTAIPKPHVQIEGAKFSAQAPKRNDARTGNVIVARSVDVDRDNKVGVPISRYNLNYVFAEPDERDHVFSDIFGKPDPHYLPAVTDLRSQWGSVLDQLDVGSCVSNSVAYAVRYCFKKQKLGDFTPSRLFIYYNGRHLAGYPIEEDTGLTIRDGYKSVSKYSTCGEHSWPYVPSRFAERPPQTCYEAAKEHKTFRYIRLDNDVNQIKKCLKDGYPVSFGAALFSSFMSAETARTGIVTIPDVEREDRIGGHAMTIVGHNDSKDAFLVANNWGDSWGDSGYCWFPYEYMTNDDLVGDLWSPRWFS